MTDTGDRSDPGAVETGPVRIRGIYATALTRRWREAGHQVASPSEAIRERFDGEFADGPAAATVTDTDDRIGVAIAGRPAAVEGVRETVAAVGEDALAWTADAQRGAVFDARVTRDAGGGAICDCGPAEGYLPYDAVDRYVETGDALRVRVVDPAPPWSDRRSELAPGVAVGTDLVTLELGGDGVAAAVAGEAGTELVAGTDLLDVEVPDGWGVRWKRAAADASLGVRGAALERAAERARGMADLPDDVDPCRQVAAPADTAFVRFGRTARFALDEDRRAVTPTVTGHHRIKACGGCASDAVDFLEAVCPDAGDVAFPFAAVAEGFGPREGEDVALLHGKPDGRAYSLGRAAVTDVDAAEARITVERELSGGGTYDALGVEKAAGDVATTTLTEGQWWYPTAYRGADGARKGTYVNVCTPLELFPDAVRYVDLHVDVLKRPDGTVERVDDDELAAAVEAGTVPPVLAERARSVAARVEDAL